MERILIKMENFLTNLAIFSVFIMMCLTTVDAIGRYLLNLPLVGAYEITEKYLMLIAVYLGASYTYRTGSNIRVNLIVGHFPRKLKRVLNIFIQIFSIMYSFLLVVPSFQNLISTYIQKTTLGSINVSLWPAYLSIPIGLFFMALFMLLDLPRVPKGKSALFLDENQPEVITEENLIGKGV